MPLSKSEIKNRIKQIRKYNIREYNPKSSDLEKFNNEILDLAQYIYDSIKSGQCVSNIVPIDPQFNNKIETRIRDFFKNNINELIITPIKFCNWTGKAILLYMAYRIGRNRDQYIYVEKDVFRELGGFCENCLCAFHKLDLSFGDLSINQISSRLYCDECTQHARDRFNRRTQRELFDREADENYVHPCWEDVLECKTGFNSATWEKPNKKTRWYGIELEVEQKEFPDSINSVYKSVGHFCIVKTDESLGSNGIEIVSVPATLEYHRIEWERFFLDSAPLLRGWHGHNCGMHIHLGMNSISKLTLGKLLVFINNGQNNEFINEVAGREQNRYCYRTKKRLTDGVKYINRGGSSHHDSLSVSTNNKAATVELRIFRSNVSRNGFLRNLEFFDALVSFVEQNSTKDMYWGIFLKWISSSVNAKLYPEFTAWAAKKSILKGKTNRPVNDPQ